MSLLARFQILTKILAIIVVIGGMAVGTTWVGSTPSNR